MHNSLKSLLAIVAICLTTAMSNSLAIESDQQIVRINTNFGDIVIQLDAEHAPVTVDNFLTYVKNGYYDNTIFHRVIDGFMIQGGGFTADFVKKQTRASIENEANNSLKNIRGTVVMARTSAPHSATSQFFINVADNDYLNFRKPTMRGWGYTVFGKVIAGMDVVDKIKKVPTGPGGQFPKDVPQTPVIIIRATIDP